MTTAPPASPAAGVTAAATHRPRGLTTLPLIGALYFMVSGGPYGLEELAHKVGFAKGALVILALPFLWCLPVALMVGELASAHPEEGGYYAWVKRALGPFWGYQEAWLSFGASVFDMAIYPTLFGLYFSRLFPSLHFPMFVIAGCVIVPAVLCNLAGSRAVGGGSVLMTALILSPFLALSLLAVLHSPAPLAVTSPSPGHTAPDADIAGGILIAMWNTMGWDNASTIAGEVETPQRTYPLAVLGAVALVTLAYVVPLVAMHVAGVDPSSWETGAWVDVARVYGGAPLAGLLVLGGTVSSFGLFNGLCLAYSRLPVVLAEDGYLPRALSRRLEATDAPWVSIIVCALIWTLSLGLPFEHLVCLDILLYGTSLMLEFVALVVLRVREPELKRPFRVPGGMVGAVTLGVGPFVLLVVASVKNSNETVGHVNALALGAGLMLLGPLFYWVTFRIRAREAH